MDLNFLFCIFFGYFSSYLNPVSAQWGLQWGWLPGTLRNSRTVRLLSQFGPHRRAGNLWSPLQHDLFVERGSSESSESSDIFKRKLIRGLKYKLSKKKRRINRRRKTANALIEKLIQDKIYKDKMVNKHRDKHTKGTNSKPHIHSVDQGTNQIKPIQKTNLVSTLVKRLLSDSDYLDATTVSPFKSNAVLRIKDSFKNAGQIKNNNNVVAEEEEIEHELPEIEESSASQNTTEEIEPEDSTTISNKGTTASVQSTDEQEIEMEETTTVASISGPNGKPTTKKVNGEQEIEAEDITTAKTSKVTSTTAATATEEIEVEGEATPPTGQGAGATADQEVEAEETTTKKPTTTTIHLATKQQIQQPIDTKQNIGPPIIPKVDLSGNSVRGAANAIMPPIDISPGMGKKDPTSGVIGDAATKIIPITIPSMDHTSLQQPKALGSNHPPVPAGEAVVSKPEDVSIVKPYSGVADKTVITPSKVGSGRRRVDDNGKTTTTHPVIKAEAQIPTKEILQFSGKILTDQQNRKLVSIESDNTVVPNENLNVNKNLSPNNVVHTPNQNVNKRIGPNIVETTDFQNQNVNAKTSPNEVGLADFQNTNTNNVLPSQQNNIIPFDRQIKFQKHGVTILKPSDSFLRKDNKVLSQSPVKQGLNGASKNLENPLDNIHNEFLPANNEISEKLPTGASQVGGNTVVKMQNGKPGNTFIAGSKTGLSQASPDLHHLQAGTAAENNPQSNSVWKQIATSIQVHNKDASGNGIPLSGTAQEIAGPIQDNVIVKPVNISWGPIATSQPITVKKTVEIRGIEPIQWGHVATSHPKIPPKQHVFGNGNKIPQNITWGSKATSGPVGRFPSLTTTIHPNDMQIGQGGRPQVGVLSKDLFEQLRSPGGRNLGSNRGRLTILDTGKNSRSRILPLPNGHVKDRLSSKIKADETMTQKWLDATKTQAVDIATGLQGEWKELSLGIKRQGGKKSKKPHGMEPTSPTETDPITFRWSPTWT